MSRPHFCGNYCISSVPRTPSPRQRFRLRPRTTPQRRVRMSWNASRYLLSKKNYSWSYYNKCSRLHSIVSLKDLQGPVILPRLLKKSATGRLRRWNLVHPIATLLIDELHSLQLKRLRGREGQHLREQCVAALGIGQEVGAHHVLREPVHRVTSVVVVDQPALHHPAQSMYVAALQREVLIGDTETIGAHQPELVEVREMNRNIGLAPATQFAQHRRALFRIRRQRVGETLEFLTLFGAWRGSPELAFVFLDRSASGAPGQRRDMGLAEMRDEYRLVPRQQFDLTRGVPPCKDDRVFRDMLSDGRRQHGQLGELAVDEDHWLAAAVFPAEHDGRCIAATRKIPHRQRLVHTLDPNHVLADAEVWPSVESELAEL